MSEAAHGSHGSLTCSPGGSTVSSFPGDLCSETEGFPFVSSWLTGLVQTAPVLDTDSSSTSAKDSYLGGHA